MANIKTSYALVTLTMRVGIEHPEDYDPASVFQTLEVVKMKTPNGKVISCDIVSDEEDIEVDIVECEEEENGNPDACDRQD
jgi:hypothetical protein